MLPESSYTTFIILLGSELAFATFIGKKKRAKQQTRNQSTKTLFHMSTYSFFFKNYYASSTSSILKVPIPLLPHYSSNLNIFRSPAKQTKYSKKNIKLQKKPKREIVI